MADVKEMAEKAGKTINDNKDQILKFVNEHKDDEQVKQAVNKAKDGIQKIFNKDDIQQQ